METNRLESKPVLSLLAEFAIPSMISMLVGSLYNLADQFFIGRTVGELGNAATNIQFPLTIACVATALLFGIGGSANFNLAMGLSKFDESKKKEACDYMGNSIALMIISGTIFLLITQLFLEPILNLFGSPADVLPYASEYTRIVSIGFPFFVFSEGSGSLLRADGRPRAMMLCSLTGAFLNIILDAIFLFVFDMGMKGAALATIIGQIVAALLVFNFLMHAKSVNLKLSNFIPKFTYFTKIAALGMAPAINQISMMLVQIVMNNSLKHYGALSVYGESIPIAVSGIIFKIATIYMAFIIGTAQGLQPIVGFNYGAKRFDRVKEAFKYSLIWGLFVSVIAFILFQLFPRQIISIFGNGSQEYYEFAVRYFRIYLFFTFVNFVQPLAANMYTAIGKPLGGTIMSLTRQVLFLIPLLIILPIFFGIDGVLYAGPIADFMAFIVCLILIIREFSRPEYKKA